MNLAFTLRKRGRGGRIALVATKTRRRRDDRSGTKPQSYKRVAIQLRDWSEWCRQVIRGAQRFAHERPDWRLYVDAGHTGPSRVLGDGVALDGIVTGVLDDTAAWKRVLRAGRTKVVAFTAAVPTALDELPRVRVDDGKVAAAIGRHLLAGGFRRLAYCAANTAGMDDARMRGMCAYAESQGVPCNVYEHRRHTTDIPLASLVRWVKKLPKPIGIATWNMTVARSVVEACQRAGVHVPEQVAVVAWDDDPVLAETLEPTLSAVVLPAEQLGYQSAKRLDQLMNGAPLTGPATVIEPSGVLRVRQSSDVSTLEDRDVHLAIQYIREHGTEPLKVPQVARVLGVSRRKLEQHFARVTGHTPHDAIVRVRLDRAKQLLLETDWGLERVAERAGMGTAQTLRRLLVGDEGLTPAEYRSRFGTTY
jgi:LacI family transcriptional regulator